MPSDSEQRLHPPSYRGCWHGVSRCFLSLWSIMPLLTTCLSYSVTAVYNPKAFILHAVSLRQAFAHCGRFSTAASRRSLGSVSVSVTGRPLRPATRHRLGRPSPHQQADRPQSPPRAEAEASVYPAVDADRWDHSALPTVSSGYSDLRGRLITCYSPVRRSTRPKAFAHDLHA